MHKLNTRSRNWPVWIALIAVLALQLAYCFSNIAVNEQLKYVESQIKEVRAITTESNATKQEIQQVSESVDNKIKEFTTEIDNLKTHYQDQDNVLQSIEQKLSKLNNFGDF